MPQRRSSGWQISCAIADGIDPGEIGLFVRSPEVIGRARTALEASGLADRVAVSVMHLAKGLEFRAVAVMACDQDILPLESRIAEAADEGELDYIYETERQFLYVACSRARDRLTDRCRTRIRIFKRPMMRV